MIFYLLGSVLSACIFFSFLVSFTFGCLIVTTTIIGLYMSWEKPSKTEENIQSKLFDKTYRI